MQIGRERFVFFTSCVKFGPCYRDTDGALRHYFPYFCQLLPFFLGCSSLIVRFLLYWEQFSLVVVRHKKRSAPILFDLFTERVCQDHVYPVFHVPSKNSKCVGLGRRRKTFWILPHWLCGKASDEVSLESGCFFKKRSSECCGSKMLSWLRHLSLKSIDGPNGSS